MKLAKCIFGLIAVLWVMAAFVSLYYLGYPSMDSWAYAAPAFYAPSPFHLVTPLLGTFEHSNEGWGLHWPGGPLLTSLPAWLLPHHPASYVAIYLGYWVLLVWAVAAVMLRLTRSWVAASFAGCLIMGSRICLNITWMQRYEMLAGAIMLAAAMALTTPQQRGLGRNVIIALSFFFLPVLHPVYLGLALGWLGLLLILTVILRKPWPDFALAAICYGAGLAAFAAYYALQPAQWLHFREHAANIAATAQQVVPGFGQRFVRLLWLTDAPLRMGGVLYVVTFFVVAMFVWNLWRQRANWHALLAKNELQLYLGTAFIGAFMLALQTFHIWYSSTVWPFAVILVCTSIAAWVQQRSPHGRAIVVILALGLTGLHALALPYRLMKWAQMGFINLRAESENFLQALPAGGQLYIPESLASTNAVRERPTLMNSLPYLAPAAAQSRYRAFLESQMRPGDVFITDRFQQNPIQWLDLSQWRKIGHREVVWNSGGEERGIDLTAYAKAVISE